MVLTKRFLLLVSFLLPKVNIVCKIRKTYDIFFFMLNFKSRFLSVVIVTRLYLLVLQNMLEEDDASF